MVGLASLGTLATIVIAWKLSSFIADIFMGGKSLALALPELQIVLAVGLVKALLIWAQEALAVRASATVKSQLRQKFLASIGKLGPTWLSKNSAAELNLLANGGLDALDPYFAKYLPQLVFTVLATPTLVMFLFLIEPVSGVIVFLTIPLIPLFMILIGMATKKVQDEQLLGQLQMANHFNELLRGLTTLRIFSRANSQIEAIATVSERQRVKTMKVLRISFLSGFALELLASLSVALIAVSIGLRLVNGDLTLSLGLFVLLLAPEAYLPLRMVGANFHAANEGVTASTKVLDLIDLAKEAQTAVAAGSRISVNFEPGKITVIDGPSGSGKTTMLRSFLGFVEEDRFDWDWVSEEAGDRRAMSAWAPQRADCFSGSLAANVVGPNRTVDREMLNESLRLAAIEDVPVDYDLGANGAMLSGGQRQRVSLARSYYRLLTQGCSFLLLDEPISALDSQTASRVMQGVQEINLRGVTVIAVSHQRQLLTIADRVIEVKQFV